MVDKLLMIMSIMLIMCTCVHAYDYNVTLNESQQWVDHYNISLASSTPNNTIYVYYFKDSLVDDSNVLSSNITEFYFENITEEVELQIDINITMGVENETHYAYINSSNSNNSIIKSFYFELKPVEISEPEWFDIDIGKHEWRVCNVGLPDNFTKDVVVGGTVGGIVNISSTVDWIVHPDNITIGDNQYFVVRINGTVPDLSIGEHSYNVTFNGTNWTDIVEFVIDVQDCGIVNRYDEYVEECNEKYERGTTEYTYCMVEAQQRYNEDWLREYASRNNTVIVEKNVTKEVPVEVMKIEGLEASDLVAKAAAKAVSEAVESALTVRIESLETDKNNLEDKISNLELERDSLNLMIRNFPKDVNETAYSLFEEVWEKERRKNAWKTTIFWLLAFSAIIGFIVYKYKENNLY